MLVAIRLCRYFGFTKVHLLGCDFKMDRDMSKPCYAFGQDKHLKGRQGNNRSYEALSRRFDALQAWIQRKGVEFEITNCFEGSGLRVFPHVPYEKAVKEAAATFAKPIDATGWYDKK